MKNLILQLYTSGVDLYCPHGRPVIVFREEKELDRPFLKDSRISDLRVLKYRSNIKVLKMKKLIILLGTTASGKTEISLKLVEKLKEMGLW